MDNQTCFWHVYFLHIGLASKARHLEPIEHNSFIKWFKKWMFCFTTLLSKFQHFENFEWFGFSSSSSKNMYLHRRGHVFVVQKNWKELYDFMFSFWLYFLEMYFRDLILLVYRIQKDINIVSKLFLNIFINLRRHYFSYWHTTVHYNYNNVKFTKIQS